MSKINILTKEIYNKIAAGEVVEKPASVVKELVENSIDAGATNITIEILDGGITQIKVSDNGSGIEKDDFDKVFLAHATSKVKTIDDLNSIGTLGFRGEALSSIASVSKITLSSKTEDSIEGYQTKVIGGEMEDITPIGATQGTYIVVEDLFFNIPARKKFLRKPKLEENEITNYISRLIMANPDISFKYVADNKIVFQSFGTGLYDAIYTIYGKSIVDNIFEVKFDRGDFKFSGYIGKPTFSKPNRTYQTLTINGRYVINQTISTAIFRAYENFIMKSTYPFFVLNLNIPLDKVDVNVHPNKLEVKFEDSNSIFGMVYSEILDILYNQNTAKKLISEDNLEEVYVDKDKLAIVDNIGSQYNENKTQANNDDEIQEISLTATVEYEANKKQDELNNFKQNIEEASENNPDFNYIPFTSKSSLFDFKVEQPKVTDPINQIHNQQTQMNYLQEDVKSEAKQESFVNTENIKVIGTLFNTYILFEKDNNMILIDQHAGHERLLYDKFVNELNNKEVAIQNLLLPYILETNHSESQFLTLNLDILTKMGFEIEDFGDDSFKVNTVPLLLENINIKLFFDNLLSDIDNNMIINKENTIKEYIAKKACKSAIKANDPLSINEIQILLNQIEVNKTMLLCPHGRPIAIEVSKSEIEKWFKRIV